MWSRNKGGWIDRQSPNSPSRGSKHSIGHGGGEGRNASFAHATRISIARHDVHLNIRCVTDSQDLIAIKVFLLYRSVFNGDFAVEHRRERVVNGALGHRFYPIRVHGRATINRAHDAQNTYAAIPLHRDLSNV